MILLFLVIGYWCCASGSFTGFGRICVLDSQTGALLYQIGPAREAGEADALIVPRSLAVHQDLCFVADTYNHAIKIFNFRQRELVRTIGSTAAAPTFLPVPCYEQL